VENTVEPLVVIWVIFLVLMCWGVAALASSRGQSGIGFFLLSFFATPLVALIVVLIMRNRTAESKSESARRRREEYTEEDRKRKHEKQLASLRVLTAAQSNKAAPQSIVSPATQSVADELIKLSALRDKAVISVEEFNEQKKRLLGRTAN